MARRFAGGGSADYVIDSDGNFVPSAVVNFYSAESGGTHYTDLLDHSGAAAAHITATALGRVLRFQYPDGVDFAWADAGDGTRTLMLANDPPSVMTLSQLVLQALPGQTAQLLQAIDEFTNPIAGIPLAGGDYVSGDDRRVLPPGDIFNAIIRLISTGGMFMAGGDMAGGVGVFGIGDRTTAPTGVPDGTTVFEGQTTRPGIILLSSNGRLHTKNRAGHIDELTAHTRRREMIIAKDGGANTVSAMLVPAPTVASPGTGAASADVALEAAWVTLSTAASSGSVAGIRPASYGQLKPAWAPMNLEILKTDAASVAGSRIWSGLFSADPSAISAPTGIHLAAFRYDSAVDGFLHCFTNNAGTPTETTTAIAVAIGSRYDLRVEFNAANTVCKFWVRVNNGEEALVATHTTGLPTYTQGMSRDLTLTALAATARSIGFSRSVVTHVG